MTDIKCLNKTWNLSKDKLSINERVEICFLQPIVHIKHSKIAAVSKSNDRHIEWERGGDPPPIPSSTATQNPSNKKSIYEWSDFLSIRKTNRQ